MLNLKTKNGSVLAGLAITVLFMTGSASASLIGDDVGLDWLWPDSDTVHDHEDLIVQEGVEEVSDFGINSEGWAVFAVARQVVVAHVS